MNKILSFTTFCALLILTSCSFNGEKVDGNGNITAEKRTVSNIKKLELEGDVNVVLTNGLASARVEADENIIPFIITQTNGETLKIKTRDNVSIHSAKPVMVFLSLPSITQIDISGSGNLNAEGRFSSSEKMMFDVSGSGNIKIEVNTPEVNAEINGSGTLTISGETRNAKIDISGSGNYEGIGLKAENAEVDIAGSGNASVFAESRLKASIAGSGNVKYKGNAAIEKSVAGSGEVEKLQ